jgi:glycosyltransferase involved in cell wall biosynthesis
MSVAPLAALQEVMARSAEASRVPVPLRRPLRIAMVLPAMHTGGMEVMVIALAKGLIARGHAVQIICTDAIGSLGPRVHEAEIPIELVPAPGIRSLVRPVELTRYLRESSIDVVHSHSGICAKASRAARSAGIPVVLHTRHGVQTPLAWREFIVVMAGALQTEVTVGCSVDVVAYFARVLPWLRNRFQLIANGIDVVAFRAGAQSPSLRDMLGIPPEAFVLGTVARLHPVKNQRLLVNALALLPESWHLVLVGDGPLRADLEQQATSLGVSERVHFAGVLTTNRNVYQAFNVFALSSISEAMPMTILEAFAAAVPVVAPRVGGIPSLLRDGELGRLFESGDAAALARTVNAVMQDEHGTARMVQHATEQLERVHSLEAMTDAYEALYYEQLDRHRE